MDDIETSISAAQGPGYEVIVKPPEFVRHSNFYIWHEGRLLALKDDPRPLADG